MSVIPSAARVQHVRNPYFRDLERRGGERHACSLEATSHPLDVGETLSWGAVVNDISAGGVKIQNAFGLVPGDPITLEFLTRRKIEGEIAWSVPPYCGVKFNAPLASDDPMLPMTAPRIARA